MIKFSFEVPFKHLEDFDDLQDFYFTLSMHYTVQEFKSFIKRKRIEGLKTIWLDNSFNEKFEADDPRVLKEIYDEFQPQKIIVPDHKDWPVDERVMALRHMLHGFQFDPESLVMVIDKYQTYQEAKEEGALHFAASYWNREHIKGSLLSQMEGLHFLGLLNVPELFRIRPRSCDTSMPIKLAMRGLTLRDWAEKGYEHINTKDLGPSGWSFFQAKMTNQEVALARYNINELRRAICNI